MILFRKADTVELERIIAFYRYVIDRTEDMPLYGRWVFGQHPTYGMIRDYTEAGDMFLGEEDGRIAAAAAVTPFQEEEYHGIPWEQDLPDHDVATVHILCVDPKKQKQCIASAFMREICRYAKEKGKKSVRLDALCCNSPAHRLYGSLGFRKRGVLNGYAENTGRIDFWYFEYGL